MKKCFESTLNEEQIRAELKELCDVFHIRWNFTKNKFIIRERVCIPLAPRVPIIASVKGVIYRKKDKIMIDISLASAMGIKDILLFVIPSFFILLYAGTEMGVDLKTILITLGAITCFTFAVFNIFSIFSEQGKDRYSEIVDSLIRSLQLREVK